MVKSMTSRVGVNDRGGQFPIALNRWRQSQKGFDIVFPKRNFPYRNAGPRAEGKPRAPGEEQGNKHKDREERELQAQ